MFAKAQTAIKKLIRGQLARHEYELIRKPRGRWGSSLSDACRLLNIETVLDVGANAGQTGRELRASGFRGRIISFEPQPDVFLQLQSASQNDSEWECHNIALGEIEATLPMTISGATESSSLFQMDPNHVRLWPGSSPKGECSVQVQRLDGLVEQLSLGGRRTIIKLDTQGYELQVLAGATEALRAIEAAYVELLYAPLYEGQSPYHEVMRALDQAGFRFASLNETEFDPVDNHPVFANGLFTR